MDLDLKRLQQVLTVVRTGSFSHAAEALHITQPALSRSIAALEERYGIRIFERGRAGASLTAIGKLVVGEAEELLRKARSVDHNLRLYSGAQAGSLAFGMGPLIGSLVLPALSIHFLQDRPQLHLHAVIKSADALYTELMNDAIEMLFCGGGQLADRTDLVFDEVGHIDVSILVRSEHPLAKQGTVSLDDIAAYPMLSGVEMSIMKRAGRAGSFICDNYHILRQTTLNTDAVWMSSPQLVNDDLRAGRLMALTLTDNPVQSRIAIRMGSRAGNRQSPAALAIRDFVCDYLTELNR